VAFVYAAGCREIVKSMNVVRYMNATRNKQTVRAFMTSFLQA
jgi:hypothetical protein